MGTAAKGCRGLVLAGGGARGSYQVGVWRALDELGWTAGAVTGTSVGCLNGAMYVLGQYETARDMWLTIRSKDVLDLPDPADSALQFVELRTQSEPLEPGLLTVRFQDLQVYGEDYATCTTLTEGSWKLSFQLAFEDASRTLPCGQTFTLNGAEVTLNAVTLSPLSIQADYTVSWAGDTAMDWIEPLPMSITYTDGTTLDLSHAGGASAYGTGSVSCQKGMIFDQLHPLEEVASVTVGDVVIPVSQS